jgi:putative intracellular protease/amidase
MSNVPKPILVHLLVSKGVSASSLYGLYDVMGSVGVGWETFVTGEPHTPRFNVRIVSTEKRAFRCASSVEVTPDMSVDQADGASIVVAPGMSVSADEPLGEPYSAMSDWLRSAHKAGASVAAACTGALVLAKAGLLDDLEATTHWAYRDLFRLCYPRVRLRPEKSLCCSDARPDIVTSGGANAWQELALFLITQPRTGCASGQVLAASGPGWSSGALHGDAARHPPWRHGGPGLPSLAFRGLRNSEPRRRYGRTIRPHPDDLRAQVQACDRLRPDGLRSYRSHRRSEANAGDDRY